MNIFQQFNLTASTKQALTQLGFTTPTPIQEKAIPLALDNKDLIGCAQTGTGKTAAFCIPVIEGFLQSKEGTALILAPTRELAQQIEEFWKKLTNHQRAFQAATLIGGMPMFPQRRILQSRPRLIIATPGRLIDHLNQKNLTLSGVKRLVLDEADRMLDFGFAPQLDEILKYLPKKRQTFLFTATWASSLDKLSKRYLTDPERITIGTVSQAASTITQRLITTSVQEKNSKVLDLINEYQEGSILIFARTKQRTDRLARYLTSYGVNVGHIHGGRSQGQRNSALKAFRNKQTRILVATDIAARGIDVTHIEHVINFDLPQLAEDYIHRIGRTGRAGAKGQALSLFTSEDKSKWNEITKLLKKSGSTIPKAEILKNSPHSPAPEKVVVKIDDSTKPLQIKVQMKTSPTPNKFKVNMKKQHRKSKQKLRKQTNPCHSIFKLCTNRRLSWSRIKK